MTAITIRPESSGDLSAIRWVVTAAFGRPAEAGLVDSLRAAGDLAISLVAAQDGDIVGHVAFSPALADGRVAKGLLCLAPVSVDPLLQRRHRIGGMLIEEGLAAARRSGAHAVLLLGHPSYYPRFGFRPAADFGLTWAGRSPGPAFMVALLRGGGAEGLPGAIDFAPAFAALP